MYQDFLASLIAPLLPLLPPPCLILFLFPSLSHGYQFLFGGFLFFDDNNIDDVDNNDDDNDNVDDDNSNSFPC